MKKYFSFCSTVAASAILSLFTTLPATAATFLYQENNSVIEENIQPTINENGNVRTIVNATVRTNPSSRATEEIIFLAPFLWTGINNNFVGLEWENSLNAWTNDDYDGLGNSITVSLTNATQRIRLGDIADVTGLSSLPLTVPCDTSPSCIPALPPFLPPLSQDADDIVPFLSFGSFAPGETKALDVVFNFAYEDDRTGTLPIFPVFGTFSASASQSVPEPSNILSLMAISAGAIILKRKSSPSRTRL